MMRTLKKLIPETHPLRLLWHRSKAAAAALRYGFPARSLTVIGITGTDGKTTTVGMVAHILNACGTKTGALSTAFFQVGETIEWNPTQKTSPSPFMIQKFLRRLVREGCSHAVLECSSHGLLQGRLDWTFPRIAGITNVSEEHLDYHGTMDAYIAAKALLFCKLRGTKVLHASDRSFASLSKVPSERTIMYDESPIPSSSHIGLWLESIESSVIGLSTTVIMNKESQITKHVLTLRIPGRFNVSNALCAIGCALAAGIEVEESSKALASFKGIAGRMERIDAGQDFSVFVDFTVTPESYRATLSTLRSSLKSGARLLVLMGSCGDRMKEKRPIIGAIAAKLADIVVVTNEDPYTEDPEKIIDDVLSGMPKDMSTVPLRISDRLEAIRTIISLAKPDDIVILCGKGSDTTMMTADGQVPWNEREIVLRELASTRQNP